MSSIKLISFCTKTGYCDLTPQFYFIAGFFSEIAQCREMGCGGGLHVVLAINRKDLKYIYLGT